MKTWIWIALAGTVVAAGVVFATAELLASHFGAGMRLPVMAGGMAGVALALAGVPFAAMVERVSLRKSSDAEFWGWWGGGLFVRMVLLMGFSRLLNFPNYASAASIAMMTVYLAGLFAEVAWLSKKLLKAEKKSHALGQS